MTATSAAALAAVALGGAATTVGASSSASYRHGLVPTVGSHLNRPYTGSGPLMYGGGNAGVGVTTGPPKVYIVFWGTQWGTAGTNAAGNITLTGDPKGMAPYYEAFFKGLGTGNELWSGVMTQYCEGVASGSTSCPANSAHVGYPTGGAFAGVWLDNASAAPSQATGNQIANEAIRAAGHFGNTTQTSNRNTQYAIVSPTGTHPDGFNTIGANWCAWHDWNGDTTLSGGAASSPYGNLAFTNMPYITDMGTSCGQNYVNGGSAGTLDGVSIVGGHEYHETITDQFPAGGWTDVQGYENGDKCAWISSGQGASANLTLTTGTFAVQSSYSNDSSNCLMSHPIVGGTPSNDFSISVSPSSQSVAAGSATTATVSTAVTSGSATTVSLSASGQPSGATVSFNPTSVTAGGSSTMTISTTTSTASGTYAITITGTSGSTSHTTTDTVTVTGGTGGGGGITNGGFETGTLSGWTTGGVTSSVSRSSHSGSYADQEGATTPTNGDSTISQTFTVPSGATTLSLYYKVVCPDTVTYDWATVTLKDNTANSSRTLVGKTCTNNGTWVHVTASVTAGHSFTLTLLSHDDNWSSDPTYVLYDDITVS